MAMSAEHKAALAQGRREGRAVKQYLESLGNRRPGRPVTPERLRDKVAGLEARIAAESDPLQGPRNAPGAARCRGRSRPG